MGAKTLLFIVCVAVVSIPEVRSFLISLSRRSSCQDKNSQCAAWAARGECSANPAYMLPNCQISCNQCGSSSGGGSTSTTSCTDHNSNCGAWAAAGECVNNPPYMFGHCQRSCDTCGISILG